MIPLLPGMTPIWMCRNHSLEPLVCGELNLLIKHSFHCRLPMFPHVLPDSGRHALVHVGPSRDSLHTRTPRFRRFFSHMEGALLFVELQVTTALTLAMSIYSICLSLLGSPSAPQKSVENNLLGIGGGLHGDCCGGSDCAVEDFWVFF